MADPMPTARLDEISALADQYREKRVAAQNALIDHNRNEVLRQESYAASIAQVFAEEYGPQLLAEVRRAHGAEAFWENAADKNGQLYASMENQRDELRAEVEKLRAENAEPQKRSAASAARSTCGLPCPQHEHACARSPHHCGPCRDVKQKGDETCAWEKAQ